jgi:superfamily II DNA or RNA helicase
VSAPPFDIGLQATALVLDNGRGALLLWGRERDLGPHRFRLWSGAAPIDVMGAFLDGAPLLEALSTFDHSTATDSLRGFATLVEIAGMLVARGEVRPVSCPAESVPRLWWGARPGVEARRLLLDWVTSMPPVGLAPMSDRDTADGPWRRMRAVLDALVDALMRRVDAPVHYAAGSFEAEVEAALAGPSELLPRLGPGPRARRALSVWEAAARVVDTPRLFVTLTLSPSASDEGFRLSTRVGTGDLEAGESIPAHQLLGGAPAAALLADDPAPLREKLREMLHALGRHLLPLELSLSSATPGEAVLSGAECWALVTGDRSRVIEVGARLEVDASLADLSAAFPKARLRLVRDDGRPASEATLAGRYLARWEVASRDRVLSPSHLREGARHAPLVRGEDGWFPLTAEAGERLARVAERVEAVWTGTQALAAALAGEVRQPGDLADAQVVCEPGMRALLAELAADVEEVGAPAGLRATLRHYQARGLSWLLHRTRLGLGALLADDMGLGKTVQLISLLTTLQERSPDDGPTLLACPASLVGNWERELARFAPGLRVVRHHGDSRVRDAAEFARITGPHDVVLTTYGLARRDAAVLAQVPWGTLVCDEAQHLKNPQSAQAKAMRSIPARRRVALSGTPVENRLSELWALMELLNPGLLGPLERFRRELANPIERERDARALRWLQASTRPFFLRRLKTDPDVAPELPEKEVIRTFCALTEEQAGLYKAAVDESLAVIEGSEGIERQGRVLKLLTRLKQVCNHPVHAGAEGPLDGRSGKLERAVEMLEEIAESGERTLVFTQYVRMGELLADHLRDRLGLEAPLFHGGLSLDERDRMVRRFQDAPDGPPVLILSLKAGGVGLNLTRASHVLHFDRWWNPAVEDQATDRAHRIGQQRRVQVHHLVTMGTLEERIDTMLEEKRQLADAVVEGGESWLTRLSTDELRALVSLGSDAAIESVESWREGERR